jgi:uncharacterized surface protein with fasciclin (FAS1) repeats
MKKHAFSLLLPSVSVFLIIAWLVGCKKTEIKQNTTDDVNIVGYLDKHLDSFSLFRQILDRTETADFLNAYGSYTCFAVTNSGVRTWLNSMGYGSVEAADLNKLKSMVKFHLLGDTLTTGSFTDGKIKVVTMYGQFLIAGITTKYGVSNYLINRQGFITQSNIKVGNGIIQVIDNVLQPAALTLAKTLEANSSQYSIFLQALRETKYYDSLNLLPSGMSDTSKGWYTLIAESNAALADSGITSYAQLKAKYSQTGNPTLPDDSLHLYVAYHVVPGIKFLGDIILSETQTTLAPQEVVTTKLINKNVFVNDDEFNGVHEPGILLVRSTSDVAATNGVVHDAKSHFTVKIRKPTAVYWEVTDFPEISKLPAYFRRAGYGFPKTSATDRPIADIDWQFTNAQQYPSYDYSVGTHTYATYNDCFNMVLGSTNRPTWYEFKTPVIIKGRYKVWICHRSAGAATCNVIIDGVTMQRTMSFATTRPSAASDADLEAIFYKRYTVNTDSRWVGRNVGIVDIATTGRHTLRLQAISGTGNSNWLDMIHFIPINDNQILPRFNVDGSRVYQ